jgi:hypothetical protein
MGELAQQWFSGGPDEMSEDTIRIMHPDFWLCFDRIDQGHYYHVAEVAAQAIYDLTPADLVAAGFRDKWCLGGIMVQFRAIDECRQELGNGTPGQITRLGRLLLAAQCEWYPAVRVAVQRALAARPQWAGLVVS